MFDDDDTQPTDLRPVLAGLDALRLWKAGTPVETLRRVARPETREFLGWSDPAPTVAKAARPAGSLSTDTLHGLAAIQRRRVERTQTQRPAPARQTRPLRKATPDPEAIRRAAQDRAAELFAKARRELVNMVGRVPSPAVAEAEARLSLMGANLARAGLLPA